MIQENLGKPSDLKIFSNPTSDLVKTTSTIDLPYMETLHLVYKIKGTRHLTAYGKGNTASDHFSDYF